MDLVVLAKAPVAGRVKTRLCPPCTLAEAAALAEAALCDTLDAAAGAGADRLLVALDGRPGDWMPRSAVVVDQGTGTLAQRLARAWSHVRHGALQIGMDTPQVTSTLLGDGLAALERRETDTLLGLAEDGGWWALGMTPPDPGAFTGVPMGRDDTGDRQRTRLRALGRRVTLLPTLRDVDTAADASAVAALAPHTRFAHAVRAHRLAPPVPTTSPWSPDDHLDTRPDRADPRPKEPLA